MAILFFFLSFLIPVATALGFHLLCLPPLGNKHFALWVSMMAAAPSGDHTQRMLGIENIALRQVEIEVDEGEAEGKFNEQLGCPLFSKLPRELRDHIWAYASAPYEDPSNPFEKTAYYYRPGHTARLRTETAFLRTCRRIWLETHAMPMLQAEHSFYFNRPAPDRRDPKWMAKLTQQNRQNFGHLHMYVQMYMIEGLDESPGRLKDYFLETPAMPGDFQPRMFHVTLRHTDFWHWEVEHPLRLDDSWVEAMLNSPDLRSTETFKLELETLDYKVPQLEPIIERLKRLESRTMETHMIDGKPAKTKFVLSGAPWKYAWEGPKNIDKQDFEPYEGKSVLKYQVVILTWKLSFPDIPRAHTAELRRAPRIDPSLGMASESSERPNSPECSIPSRYERDGVRATELRYRTKGRRHAQRRYRHLQMCEWRVRIQSMLQAVSIENMRGQDLDEWNAQIRRQRWQDKWQDERSLLKFGRNSLSDF